MTKYLEYTVVMVFVSSILTLQQKYIEIMKVTCKKTGKNMTGKVIENIERQESDEWIDQLEKQYNEEQENKYY